MVKSKTFVINAFGPPEAHGIEEVEIGKPGVGQVLVQIIAAGLNFPDALIIQGKYQFRPPFPFSPGAEVSGIVKAVGPKVDDFVAGDRVIAMTGWGGFTELAVLDTYKLTKIPAEMRIDFSVAASFSMTYGTTMHAFKQRAKLQQGETVLVLGAAGGTGLSAVELAKTMGALVIAAASTDEKLAICRQFGADYTINYTTENLKERLKDITGGNGVDVVYDPVGDKYAEPAIRSLSWKGRYLVIGFAGGEIPKIPLNLPLLKGSSIVGVFWGAFVSREFDESMQNMKELMNWIHTGRLKPLVSTLYALEDAGKAIRDIMERKIIGKAVILCSTQSKI